MPPIVMFDKRQRPRGLEFASCETCNVGTKHADLLAALVGRSTPESHPYQPLDDEWENLCKAINNNIPGALEEMIGDPNSAATTKAKELVGDGSEVIRLSGPIVSSMMTAFCIKVGLALHYEVTRNVLAPHGGISVRWFSNHDAMAGKIPEGMDRILGPPQTLRQGKKQVSDQFQYAWAVTDTGRAAMTMATFRFAFAVIAFTADDAELLRIGGVKNPIYPPGKQLELIRISGSS